MRPLRHLEIGPTGKALVEITVRTVHSRFLLRPGTLVNALILGILAKAQHRYGIQICAYAFLSNHFHLLLVTDSVRRLASFMQFLNSNIARKIGRIHGWRQKFFGRRYRAIQVSDEAPAQVQRLRYLLSQGAKEGLVNSPLEWPGAHAAWNLTRGIHEVQGWWEDQTEAYRARLRGEEVKRGQFRSTVSLELSKVPCWEHLDDRQYRDHVKDLVADIENDVKVAGIRTLGNDRICKQNPHDAPEDTNTSPAPDFHAASREERLRLKDAYRAFVASFRLAAQQLKLGNLEASFPPDCFPPRFPVPVSQPPPPVRLAY